MISQKQPAPLRILLVEDSQHDQIVFERALVKSGLPFELTVCERAEELHTAMQGGSRSFDLVLVDYDLPGQNGLEIYRELQQKSDLPPFVMLTGAGSESLAVDALKAGMYDYIIKDPNQGYLRLLPLKLTEVKQRHQDRRARLQAKAELKKAYGDLERMVAERTVDLAQTVEALEREITERIRTEQALRRSERALRSLSLKIVETQENERRLIAKELHDELVEGLEKVVGHLQDTIQEVRRISTSLRPSMLDDLGLLATVRWFCNSTGEIYADTRIETRFDLQEDDIPEYAKIVLLRVVQEALNNALKHSRADTVRISLENEKGCIRLCVTDDGCGFVPEAEMQKSDPMTGYGLRGMYDRAEVIGASLTIDSAPGRGAAVCMERPCDSDLATR